MRVSDEIGLPDHYPVVCPSCRTVSGVAVAVTTVADQPRLLRLELKCGECHHRWWREFDAPIGRVQARAAAG